MSRLTIMPSNHDDGTINYFLRDFERRVAASPPGVCPIELQLSFLKFSHAQTCGKCVPCRIGLGQIENLMEDILDQRGDLSTISALERLSRDIYLSADCAIGYDAASIIVRGLDIFRDDYLSHVIHKKCIGAFGQPIPCTTKCPARVDVPGYVALIHNERYKDAIALIRKDNPFPAACAYTCEHPCEERCRRSIIDSPVNIRGLKRYAVDNAGSVNTPPTAPPTGKKVAIIGGGPSGLTAAYFLQLMGHQTTIFESSPQLGGMLRYGIPPYRLPRERLDEDISAVLSTGAEVKINVSVGKDVQFSEIKKAYDAVYIAIGAQSEKSLRIDGIHSENVISAVKLLREISLGNLPDYSGKNIVVIGGGNVALDCARSAVRLGAAKVSLVYRRRQEDMTALPAEVESAIAEGVELVTLMAPVKINADSFGRVSGLVAQPQITGLYGKADRPTPVDAKKDPINIPCDIIVLAVGQDVDSAHFAKSGLSVMRNLISAKLDCSVPMADGVFAGGDCVFGPATVIKAIAAGKTAAANIDQYLGFDHKISCDVLIPEPILTDKPAQGRVMMVEKAAVERVKNFDSVECPMSLEEARQESARCLRCDHYGCGNFKVGASRQW